MVRWNPWHGCHKLSEGCRHCYVHRIDGRHGRNSEDITKNRDFDLPVRRGRDGHYKIPSGTEVATCFSSDFFLEDADMWRGEAWRMIRERQDLTFLFITKRIDRFAQVLPDDWGDGYKHVVIGCTMENQERATYRLPYFRAMPAHHKFIVCEPLLGAVDLSAHLGSWVESVVAGGESGPEARICDYDWVLDLRRQCVEMDIPFRFRQTGALFRKDGRVYRIKRSLQFSQARKADINYR